MHSKKYIYIYYQIEKVILTIKLVKELVNKFQIKHGFSTPYHTKTNGLVKRFTKTLCEAMATLIKHGQNWDKFISSVLFAY